ncbi:hypothetical protein OBJ93_06885 [Empedobacter falsenii]
MKKEAAIKNAYIEYWEQLSNEAQQQALQNNGFIHQKYLIDSRGSLLDCLDFEWMDTYDSEFGLSIRVFRPKSLQGIETNNGWIKIESEDDLPNDDAFYYKICVNNKPCNDYSLSIVEIRRCYYNINNVTHYQPIEEQKPPIY